MQRARSYATGFGSARRFAANQLLLKGFVGINVAVFGWNIYAQVQARQGYTDNFVKYTRNMTLNATEFKNGYWWQAATCMFAHADIVHLGFNMFTFWSLGGTLCALPVTPGQFTFIVLGSGLAGSLFWLAQRQMSTQSQRSVDRQRALGFSGALMGAISVVACFLPREKVQLFAVIPVPLWACVLGYGIYDGYYLNHENTRVAHAGHLGGLAFGLAYYLLKLRRRRLTGSL